MPKVNKALLCKVIRHIEQNPQEWAQEVWESECGTRACVAGWAIKLSGQKVYDLGSPSDRAKELLGITEDQACRLFNGVNYMEDIRSIVKQILAEDAEQQEE